MSDNHPADGLIDAIHGLINGDSFKQNLRDAWERITRSMPSITPKQQEVDSMNKATNDARVQRANKAFIDQQQAAQIRAKAKGK